MKYVLTAVTIGIFGGWLWLYLNGCEQPFCRILGVYTYRVDRLEEYVEYVSGADLYTRHQAASLIFSCESLRDQLTTKIHQYFISEAPLRANNQLRDEVVRLGLLGARREGKTLHMMNEVMVGSEDLDTWASQVTKILQGNPKNESDNWLPIIIKRLFSSVVLHAGDRKVEIPISPEYPCD